MSDIDDLLEEFGAVTLEENFGVTVAIKRGSLETTGVPATWENQSHESVDTSGLLVKVESRDFVIARREYKFGGEEVEPRASDIIIQVEGGATHKFEAMPFGEKPAVSPMPGGYRWRVRTKQVKINA